MYDQEKEIFDERKHSVFCQIEVTLQLRVTGGIIRNYCLCLIMSILFVYVSI